MQNGQPNAQFIKEQKNAKEYYDLGKDVAKVAQDKREIEQGLAMTMIQKAQVQDAAFQTKMMMTELQTMLSSAMGGMMPPSAPQGQPPMGQDDSMPPAAGGIDPSLVSGGGGGQPDGPMPPPMM